jgi:glucose-6-phosphate isomerase
MSDITKLPSWQALSALRHQMSPCLKDMFAADPDRFKKFSITLPGMLVDFSKNIVTDRIRSLLLSLAEESGLARARHDLFKGEKINTTENRSVLHMALRAPPHAHMTVDGRDVTFEVQKILVNMRIFANAVRNGEWRGYGGRQITDIVNIGIGGSVLGPQLATEALSGYHHPRLTCHYVSNVDASDLARVLGKLSPETTLFIIASKTFTTAETMQNARIAREWVLSYYQDNKEPVACHFVAASTNAAAVKEFGIAPANMFPFQDWVGGRYSVWSSIGLSTMIMAGPDNFLKFLAGAYEMDEHFRRTPFEYNLPVMMALTGVWYRNFMNYPAYAVIPYHAVLRRLPAFLQQLDMESNGKSVARDGLAVPVKTSPIVFGEPGTDAQHTFFQWLHQGSDIVPVDFIAAIKTPYDTPEQRTILLANFLAQSEALMVGKKNDAEPHRNFSGNRPSTTILFDELNPRSIGMLLALYEHKVFVQGVVWGINSFDQWGVELGKNMAKTLEKEIVNETPGQHDSSTLGLLNHVIRRQSRHVYQQIPPQKITQPQT